jgi:hypothetical protein
MVIGCGVKSGRGCIRGCRGIIGETRKCGKARGKAALRAFSKHSERDMGTVYRPGSDVHREIPGWVRSDPLFSGSKSLIGSRS